MVNTVTRRHEWDMAHRLPFHEGKCRRLHGHRYVADITVIGRIRPDTEAADAGMILDFDAVKAAIDQTFGWWDHRTMLWERDPLLEVLRTGFSGAEELRVRGLAEYGVFSVPFMPTAENIAREILKCLTRTAKLSISTVKVFETPNGWSEAYIREA